MKGDSILESFDIFMSFSIRFGSHLKRISTAAWRIKIYHIWTQRSDSTAYIKHIYMYTSEFSKIPETACLPGAWCISQTKASGQ